MLEIKKLHKEIVGYKPTPIPPGFKLIIDTRERNPLFQGNGNRKLKIIHTSLKHGDYSIRGMENKVTIERKQLSDLLSYVGKDRKNTERKLESLSSFYFKALVIEVKENELFNLPDWTRISPEAIRGFLKSVRVKYDVHVFINHKRPVLERWILDHLTYAYIQMRKV